MAVSAGFSDEGWDEPAAVAGTELGLLFFDFFFMMTKERHVVGERQAVLEVRSVMSFQLVCIHKRLA